jgi:hypothetical protein
MRRQKLLRAFSWPAELGGLALACAKSLAVHCGATRIWRALSVLDADSIPAILHAVFKNKTPLACAGRALFLNTGGGKA